MRVELMTPSLPRRYSTTELQRRFSNLLLKERFSSFKSAKIHFFFELSTCAKFFIFLLVLLKLIVQTRSYYIVVLFFPDSYLRMLPVWNSHWNYRCAPPDVYSEVLFYYERKPCNEREFERTERLPTGHYSVGIFFAREKQDIQCWRSLNFKPFHWLVFREKRNFHVHKREYVLVRYCTVFSRGYEFVAPFHYEVYLALQLPFPILADWKIDEAAGVCAHFVPPR